MTGFGAALLKLDEEMKESLAAMWQRDAHSNVSERSTRCNRT